MTVIKAPYNFVPFNKQVVTPHWIDQISHDIPFKDGLSGQIEVKLTAMSPIFVRDGVGQAASAKNYKDGVQQQAHTFSQAPDGRYFIPGTSIKGMIRSVLEILSFGRMEGKVNDHRTAFRDLSEPMKNIYRDHFKAKDLYGGWLKKVGEDRYVIEGYAKPGRISHQDIDNGLGTDFAAFFSPQGEFDGAKDEDKAAKAKYDRIGELTLDRDFSFIKDTPGGKLYRIDEFEENKGTIVFTGQPGVGEGSKRLEFIFWKKENSIEVEPDVMKGFFDAYFEYDQNRWSIDWEKRREELENGKRIPVFFQKETWRGKERVQHLGLSFLYKLPGKHSTREAINLHQDGSEDLDLSEAIFGSIAGAEALKGRVHIGHAFLHGKAEEDEIKKEVLSSPKPSFFPNYIVQKNGKNGRTSSYSTLIDDEVEVAGWKRYPVLADGTKHSPKPADAKSDKILTQFKPLKDGAAFTFDINFHNLRPIELGALLSAITFHDAQHSFHSLGMAKPLGYGKVKLDIAERVKVLPVGEKEPALKPAREFMSQFEAYMNYKIGTDQPKWHESEQVKELVAMSVGSNYDGGPYLDPDGHREVRNAGEYLERYSKLHPNTATPVDSLTSPEEIAQMASACMRESELFTFQAEYAKKWKEHQENLQAELDAAFARWKDDLLQILKRKKKEVTDAAAAATGPDWDDVNLHQKKKAFENLKKAVETYGKKKEGQNDLKKVLDANPNGYLPPEYHSEAIIKLSVIFDASLNAKEQAKWRAPFEKNAIMKKIAEWVGEEKTQQFLASLQE